MEPLPGSRPTYWWFNEVARLVTNPRKSKLGLMRTATSCLAKMQGSSSQGRLQHDELCHQVVRCSSARLG